MGRLLIILSVCSLSGCFAYGSMQVEKEGLSARARYMRFGDQKLQDFYVQHDVNGTSKLGLGKQESDATALREVLLRALGVQQ